jgi:phospholipid/cholesterol/gamma-HCH transport system substrate-binding protein
MTRRRHGSRLSHTAAGLLTVGLVVAAFYAAFIGVPFTGGHEVKAVFAHANEVQTRSPVRIAGVEVGQVTGVERGPGGTALVTMELDDDALPVHADATIKIRPRIFLEGNFFLDMRAGTPSAPELDEGDTIPLAQTATPVQLDQILSGLQRGTRENLRTLIREYRTALDEGGADAFARGARPSRQAFAGAAQVAEAFRGSEEGDLSGFVDTGGRTAAALARNEDRLAELVTGLNRTARGLAGRRDALARSVRELDGVLEQARPALAELNALVPTAREFVADVRPGIRELPETLALANPLVDQVAGILRPNELPALRRQLDPALRALAGLEPGLEELLSLVTPVTECLRRNAIPTAKTAVDDPPHTTGEPVYRELLYGLVGLSSASQNFDGNGPAVRYHAGAGQQTLTTGRLPGTNELIFGLTETPLLGSRPRFPGRLPPYRPDVPCITQEPPNLQAETGPAPPQVSVEQARRLASR